MRKQPTLLHVVLCVCQSTSACGREFHLMYWIKVKLSWWEPCISLLPSVGLLVILRDWLSTSFQSSPWKSNVFFSLPTFSVLVHERRLTGISIVCVLYGSPFLPLCHSFPFFHWNKNGSISLLSIIYQNSSKPWNNFMFLCSSHDLLCHLRCPWEQFCSQCIMHDLCVWQWFSKLRYFNVNYAWI